MSVDKVNQAFESIGSDFRVKAGDDVSDSIAALIESLAAYTDRRINEAMGGGDDG